MSSADYEQVFSQLPAGVLALLVLGCFIVSVLSLVAMWRIFTKAGQAGWKCLIPIYNGYMLFKIAWRGSIFWLSALLGAGAGIFCTLGLRPASSESMAVLLYALLALVCSIAVLVLTIRFWSHLSKAFGHGLGFTLGLLFFNTIFLLILGLGGSRYVKNGSTAAK
jgi:hypothetical protein